MTNWNSLDYRWAETSNGAVQFHRQPFPVEMLTSDAVVVRALGPGRVSVSLGEVILAELRGGEPRPQHQADRQGRGQA